MWLNPLQAPGVLFCDVGCRNGLPDTRGGQNQGRAKVFTGSINRMELSFIQREEPRHPGDSADNGFIINPMHML